MQVLARKENGGAIIFKNYLKNYLGTYISILRKIFAQRRILLAKTYEQQTTKHLPTNHIAVSHLSIGKAGFTSKNKTKKTPKKFLKPVYLCTYLNKKNKVYYQSKQLTMTLATFAQLFYLFKKILKIKMWCNF